MNIAFDATAILGPMSKNRGIGNYALSQFTTMINMDKENNYFFFNLLEDYKLSQFIENISNFKVSYFYCGKDNFLLKNTLYNNIIGDIIRNYLKKNKIDVFYITSPFESTYPIYKKEWFKNVKVVATVYDIIPYVLKDKYLADKNTYNWYMKCVEMLKWVDKCLVISNSVKEDMVKYLDFDETKIAVIHGAVNEFYKKIDIDEGSKKELFSKFGIEDKYILCTGGDDDRKNIKDLIIAYSKIGKELINEYQLVIVCKLSADSINSYTKIIKDNKVSGRVILTNFVDDDELLMLYNLAYLMAFPSKYEGFGLPVVEAFACGTPVLTSNNSSLGEIASDAAVLVNPYSVKDITQGLIKALTITDLNKLIENGYKKLKTYNWENVSRLAIDEINKLDIKRNNVTEKKKIAFFSPLPPLESGISDYSVDILNALSKYFDIDVYIDDNYKPECEVNDGIKIYNHRQFKKNAILYQEIIFQVGNSGYHVYMWEYIKKYQGLIVLHDYNLHPYVQHHAIYLGKNNWNLYREILLEDFDERSIDDYITHIKNGTTVIKQNEMELNGFIVNYAKKIIVHSNEAREKLLKKNIYRNVRTIHSYAKIEPLIDNNIIKSKLNIDKDTIIMASFGHIQETKRALPILKAFNRLCKEHDNIKYYFVGKPDKSIQASIQSFIKENSLEDKVIITGYTPIDEFTQYIDLADICFNLRFPYNGETSGSLMRILAKGKCVVVNNIGSFGEIPNECCIKLPSAEKMSTEAEVDAIYKAMVKLIKEENRVNLSKNARKFAEDKLDINIISKQYANFINEVDIPVLNESLLSNVLNNEIKPKKYNYDEIFELSKTLGFCKNTHRDISTDNEINVENIMAEIRRQIKLKGA
jgi:glycosyltransferase involved in cell wall biosynthesis